MKRVVIFIIIGVIVGGLALYYYLSKPEPVVDSVYRAVPLNAALLIEIKDYEVFRDNLLVDNSLWNELSYLPLFSDINRKARFIDSVFRSDNEIYTLLGTNRPVLISGHPSGKDDIQLVYYLRLDAQKDFNKVDKMIRGFRNKSLEVNTRTYENATIADVAIPGESNASFSYTWSHGLLMISKSSILIEDAIRQIGSKELLLNKKYLQEIIKTSGKKAPVNLYFNVSFLPQIAQNFIHTKHKKGLTFLKDLGTWMEFDLNAKPDLLIFNGFSAGDAEKPGMISVFKGQKPLRLDMFNVIPSTAHTFTVLGLSKYLQYRREYEKLSDFNDNNTLANSIITELKEKYNIDIITAVNDLFDQEAAIAFSGEYPDSVGKGAWTIIKTKGAEESEKFLQSIVTEYSQKNGLEAGNMVYQVKTDNGKEIKIWAVPFMGIPSLLFGKLFDANQARWCTLSGNYMVFAESKEMLVNYHLLLDQNATIGTDLDFNTFSDFFASQSNFFFYTKPQAAQSFYGNFFKDNILQELVKQREHFSKIGTVVYQFTINDQNLIYHNFFIRYSGDSILTPKGTQNGSDIDGDITSRPLIIKNPSTKEPETLVQDNKNQMFLINKHGRKLWKLQLPEPVKSEVYFIDYYKNGKQQILFNTRTKLYIIDRNGNFIEKYPVSLPNSASNGLALFDYEKNREYRIVYAGEDRKIYVLDKNGQQVTQWAAAKTDSEVVQPVQFFRIEGKDYLVYHDRKSVYIVDRKGKRLAETEKLEISVNNTFSLINARSRKEARLICSSTTGSVYSVTLDGKTRLLDFGKYPADHWFDVYDVDGDNIKDFVYTWSNSVKAVSQKNKDIFSISLPGKVSERPQFFSIFNDVGVGVTVGKENKIFLYNNKGELYNGFPLKGDTQFSVEVLDRRENKLNLTVGSKNNLLYQNAVL